MVKEVKINSERLKQTIGFVPSAKQQEILFGLQRFNTVSGGKRSGKTILAAYLALKELFTSDKNIWVAAPTYDLTKRIWDYLVYWADRYFPNTVKYVGSPEPRMESKFYNSRIELKSIENEKSLLGKPLDLFIGDEAALFPNHIWAQYIRPNLMDRKGRSFLITNPYGMNWFYELHNLAHEDYSHFHVPTAIEENGIIIGTNNPTITVEELNSIKAVTPEPIWRSAYLAEFDRGMGAVFQNVKSCIKGELKQPEMGHFYVVGADLAKSSDFTVLVVFDLSTNHVVHFERLKNRDWNFIKSKIESVARRYNNALVRPDSTGVGDPITEDLIRMGLNVEGYKYGVVSKKQLIENLIVKTDQAQISFPDIPELVNEMNVFTYQVTEKGHITYNAPSGYHDDCVNALALACWGTSGENLTPISEREIEQLSIYNSNYN